MDDGIKKGDRVLHPPTGWPLVGEITRIARDGSWVDVWWGGGYDSLGRRFGGWRKRMYDQPLEVL